MLRKLKILSLCLCLAGWFSSGVLPHSLAIYTQIVEQSALSFSENDEQVEEPSAQKDKKETTADRQKPEPQPETIVEATGLQAVVPMQLFSIPKVSFIPTGTFSVDYRLATPLLRRPAHLTLRLLHSRIFGSILTNAP